MLLVNLLMLSVPIFSMQVLDRVLGSGNVDTLLMLLLVITLALSLLSLIQGSRSFAMNKLGAWFEKTRFLCCFKAWLFTRCSAMKRQAARKHGF